MISKLLSSIWTRLIEASPKLAKNEKRQSELLALAQLAVLLALLPLALITAEPLYFPLLVLLYYALNRLGYVAISLRLSIYGSTVAILLAALHGNPALLTWLILPLLLSLAFLSQREHLSVVGLLMVSPVIVLLGLPVAEWDRLMISSVALLAVFAILSPLYWSLIHQRDVSAASTAEGPGRQGPDFRQMIEQSPDFVYLWQPDSDAISYINQRNFLGYSRDELARPGFLASLVHPDDRAALDAQWHGLQQGGSSSPIEFRLSDPQGNWVWLERQSTLLRDEARPGQPAQVLIVLWTIAARKAREIAMLQQEARNTALLSAVPDMIVRMDGRGYYLEVWPFKAARDRRPEYYYDQLVGKHILDVLEQPVAQEILNRIQLTLNSEDSQFMTYALNEVDGRHYYEAHWVRYGDDEVLATIRDISSRKQDEDRLQREASIYRHMVEAIIVSEMVDNEPHIVNMNLAAEKLYGWSLDEVRGRPFVEVIRPEYSADFPREKVRQALMQHGHWAAEVVHHHRDGRAIPVYSSSGMAFDDAGQPLSVVTVALDLTQQKETEAALKMSEVAQRRSERMLQTLIDSVPIIIWALDKDGTISMSEGRSLREDSQPSSAVVGQSAYSVFADEPRMLYSIERALNGESFTAFHEHNGVQYQTHFHPVYDPQGEIDGLAAVTIDLSERTLLESNRLELALERERINMLQRFMGDVSHDFKTPLTSIKLSLHLLSRASTPEARQRHLDVMDMQTNRLETFMADLFNMSRYDRGETNEFSFAPVDCHALIEEIIAAHQLLVEEKQQRLHWEPGDIQVEVLGDRLQLDRMLTNLLINAITYTPVGGEIWLRSQRRDYWLIIEVRDNGPGIPEEDHERIFQRFYRGDPARSSEQGGMGLGLAIAHKIVEAHGGKIELESAAGQGSCFRISLPCTDTHTA